MTNEMKALALAQSAADRLRGTCDSLTDLGPEFEEAANNTDFCAHLDSMVFECTICNWWYDLDEMAENDENDDFICVECHNK